MLILRLKNYVDLLELLKTEETLNGFIFKGSYPSEAQLRHAPNAKEEYSFETVFVDPEAFEYVVKLGHQTKAQAESLEALIKDMDPSARVVDGWIEIRQS